jgi:hypothetical protein
MLKESCIFLYKTHFVQIPHTSLSSTWLQLRSWKEKTRKSWKGFPDLYFLFSFVVLCMKSETTMVVGVAYYIQPVQEILDKCPVLSDQDVSPEITPLCALGPFRCQQVHSNVVRLATCDLPIQSLDSSNNPESVARWRENCLAFSKVSL